MDDLAQQKAELQSLVDRRRHDCRESLGLRRRAIAGHKQPAFVQQCRTCGRQCGGAIARSKLSHLAREGEPAWFDDDLQTAWDEEGARVTEFHRTIYDNEHMRPNELAAHALLSSGIKALEAASGADKVIAALTRHTLKRIEDRRREAAGHVTKFAGEVQLSDWLASKLGCDFDIYSQVSGTHIADSKAVVIDHVLYPKPHLVAAGFADTPIGIEAKWLDQDGGFTRKMTRAVWQAVSYMDSSFGLRAGPGRLKAVLLFTNLSFAQERQLLRVKGWPTFQSDSSEWDSAMGVANHAGVGGISIEGDRDQWTAWWIHFGGGRYFGKPRGGRFIPGNPRLLGKVRVGNF